MTKKKFNINEWTPEPQQRESAPSTPVAIPENLQDSDIEIVTQRIEAAGTDITANYQDWLGLAFALAGELGEAGHSYFKRLSRFYPGYDEQEADKKFSSCLASGKGSVGISTFFHLGQKAGVSVSVKRLSAGANADFLRLAKKRSPRFPEAHCWFLQLAYGRRLTHSGGGAITAISACLPNYSSMIAGACTRTYIYS